MIRKLLNLFKKESETLQLYIYQNEVIILNDRNQIVSGFVYNYKLTQNEKVNIRRYLKKIHSDCTVKITGGYKTYLGEGLY